MILLYNLGIRLYYAIIKLSSTFNPKAKQWLDGRAKLFSRLQQKLAEKPGDYIWIHCASLGEFEQGRPLIEEIKRKRKERIILTFFSPSGYEIRKDYPKADIVEYLPLDTSRNASKFLNLVKPKAAFFVKYEFWPHYLTQLKKQNTPVFLVSGKFRSEQVFFKWYGNFSRRNLGFFKHFFVQEKKDKELLKNIGLENSSITGDTRFDRVWEITRELKSLQTVSEFCSGNPVIIGGSTWQQEEALLADYMERKRPSQNLKLIIAPHEIDPGHLKEIEDRFSLHSPLRYSKLTKANANKAKVLIIDNVGLLSSIYQYGTLAIIGGGFSKGIHNTLEAVCFGLPVLFGPRNEKFKEARDLLRLGVGIEIKPELFGDQIDSLISNHEKLGEIKNVAIDYIQNNCGATQKIMSKSFQPDL